jgi:transcriptional regulator with XRE-family HTH domain
MKLNRIQEVLDKKNMTQKELAKKMGISTVTCSHWCSGKSNPPLKKLVLVSEVLEVSLYELIVDK